MVTILLAIAVPATQVIATLSATAHFLLSANQAENSTVFQLRRYYLEQFPKYAISDQCPTGCFHSLARIVGVSVLYKPRRANTASSVFRVTRRSLWASFFREIASFGLR